MRRLLTLLFATIAFAACSLNWDKEPTPEPLPEPEPKPENDLAAKNNEIIVSLIEGEDINAEMAKVDLEAFEVEFLSVEEIDQTTYRLTFSEDIDHIGDFAFRGCKAISEVYLPESLDTMGIGVFAECANLDTFHSHWAFCEKDILMIDDTIVAFAPYGVKSIAIDFAKYVGDYSFTCCEELKHVEFLEGVEVIGAWSFSHCVNLLTAYFGDDVQTIKEGAFYNCPNVTFTGKFNTNDNDNNIKDNDGNFVGVVTPPTDGKVDLGDSTGVGEGAMQNSKVVTELTIPESVERIAAWAFDGCVNLRKVTCKPIVPPTAIYSTTGVWAAFDNNAEDRKFYVPAESLEAYKTAEGWRDYADYIFPMQGTTKPAKSDREILYTNGSTTEPTLPKNENAFNATIISNVYDAERECWVMTFDSKLTTIGETAFERCNFESVYLPYGVEQIDKYAFIGCTMQYIYIPESVTSIGTGALIDLDYITEITIPDNVTSFGKVVVRGQKLTKINNKNVSEDGRCLIIDGTLNSFAYGGVETYRFPDGITTIGDSACCYSGCSELTIPASVHTIEFGAFVGSQTKILHCEPTTPPTLTFFTLNTQGLMEAIYVPAESVEAYKTAEYWSDFADIIMAE
ncbi:MAG: leucine-rich repeat protein [Alistipes sp.]|nr:leucine-rich repeat protein [Alistipes sp.]